jgi:hypothetical protein
MTTTAQSEANKQNAARSTGPKTPRGKDRASRNALRHGLHSARAVLPGENAAQWEQFRDGIVRSLAPAGTLEQELAARVALCLWRLRRVAAFETATAAAALAQIEDAKSRPREREAEPHQLAWAEKELKERRTFLAEAEEERALADQVAGGAADELPVHGYPASSLLAYLHELVPHNDRVDIPFTDLLKGVGVPTDERNNSEEWTGWTVGLVRKGLRLVAQQARFPLEELQARLAARARENVEESREEVRRFQKEVQTLRRRLQATEERRQATEERVCQQRCLPDAEPLDKVLRYESHVSRQMLQTLHTLERLQAARAGADVPPPAALDVNVNGPTPALEMALENASRP